MRELLVVSWNGSWLEVKAMLVLLRLLVVVSFLKGQQSRPASSLGVASFLSGENFVMRSYGDLQTAMVPCKRRGQQILSQSRALCGLEESSTFTSATSPSRVFQCLMQLSQHRSNR